MTTSSSPPRQPGDVTLGSYDAAAHLYLMHSAPPRPAVLAYLDEVARLVGDGTVLELGSLLRSERCVLGTRPCARLSPG